VIRRGRGVGAVTESKYIVQAGWDDVPHLDEKTKRELLASTPHYQKDARSKGEPSLGAGAIYPIPKSEITVLPFALPKYWPRAYGFDVGWNRTAAIWGAHDRDVDCIYCYAEHYRGQAEPSVHAASIKARGAWIPGAIDPASRGRSQVDGEQLIARYRDNGLLLHPAINAVDAGLHEVFTRLSTARLKLFTTLQNTMTEYSLYRRNEKGAVIKELDHLMDALRYLVMTIQIAKVPPQGAPGVQYAAADPNAGY
jgi:hypothetical protein